MITVAIFGAHGQIARGLIEYLPRDWDVRPFSRDPGVPNDEAAARGILSQPYERFADGEYDLVVNAAGPGDPGVHRVLGADIFCITEKFDNLALDYLAAHPSAAYVNISTGAVYGAEYGVLADDPVYLVHVNRLAGENPYVLAKLNAEAKHRHAANLRIADLRVFGYYSRRIDMRSQFFLAQAAAHLCDGRPFATPPHDFVRDFVSPDDLAAHIVALVEQGVANDVYDVLSAAPATKFELLDALSGRFGLRYVVEGGRPARLESPKSVISGRKCPKFTFSSKLTSIQLVMRETEALYRLRDKTL